MSKPIRILFVCLGNICRSPLAHGIMNELIKTKNLQSLFSCDSCGLYGEPEGEDTHPGSQDIIKQKMGIKFSKSSRHFRAKQDYHDFDLILAMDQNNLRNILREVPDSDKKVRMFRDFDPQGKGDVPDPYYAGGFDKVYDMCFRTISNIIQMKKEQLI